MAYSNNVITVKHTYTSIWLTHHQSRSFTSIGSNDTSDHKSNGSSLNSPFGSTNKAWGSNSIWSSGSLSNGFPSRVATRDNSRSRDGPLHNGANEGDLVHGKTGSGSLVDSSVSDDWNYKTPWGAKRSLPSASSAAQTKFSDLGNTQQRSVSNAGYSQGFGAASQTAPSFTSRPPTVNLSSNIPMPSRSSYASSVSGSFSARGNEQPPNVYTKFDRPSDPNTRKFPDSARSGSWIDSSPTEARNVQLGLPLSSRASVASSRNGSQPPSRHEDDRPLFSKPDYSRPSLRPSQNNSRAPSISSQRNGSYSGPYLSPNAEQVSDPFSNLTINGSSRPSTSGRPSTGSRSFYESNFGPTGLSSLARPQWNGAGFSLTSTDGATQSLDAKLAALNLDAQTSSQHTLDFTPYGHQPFSDRYLQQATIGDVRSRQNFAAPGTLLGNGDSARPRSSEWRLLPSDSEARNLQMPTDQPTYLDPRMQQLLSASLQNPYNSLYGQYPLTNTLPLGATASFMPFVPMTLPGLGPSMNSPDALCGDNLTSAIMYEFKSNTKTKRYELKDIYNHIAEFSGDQHGSRFIQTKLETANSDEKERVFQEIRPNALPLMTDVFGNYVIQKFFEHGDQTHKKILANKMKGQVLHLSLQMYGCRVVQKALDHVLVDQQAQLVSELENNVLKCVKDQNGNHVIQKAIERCPANTIGFIIAAFRGQVQHLSIHPYGCRVIQRCLERCEPTSKAMIMHELMDGIQSMISDQYGNYVVQHVVEHDVGEARRRVLDIVGNSLEAYSKHKFASNVVEKCLEKADDAWRRGVVSSLASGDQRRCEGEAVLVGLIKDNFGNYVIQKLLDTLSPDDYGWFLDLLQPAMTQAKRTGCGKQVLSIEKKMHRFPSLRTGFGNAAHMNAGIYQLPLPPLFSSYHGSAATTPPPLTSDTQSLQSSGIPSINGDTVEGATASLRKGSDIF